MSVRSNRARGLRFEAELARRLSVLGVRSLPMSACRAGDLAVINSQIRIVECKVVSGGAFRVRNLEQHALLTLFSSGGASFYYAVRFVTGPTASEIRLFHIGTDSGPVYPITGGYSLEEFVEHIRGHGKKARGSAALAGALRETQAALDKALTVAEVTA